MTEHFRTIADRATGDGDPRAIDIRPGDRVTFGESQGPGLPVVVRIERPVPTTEQLRDDEWDGNWRTISQDEQTARRKLATWTKADLIDRHIGDWQRDLQFRESAQEQLDEWVTRARAAEAIQTAPQPPTREQIADAIEAARRAFADWYETDETGDGFVERFQLALIQNGADR